VRGVGGGAEAGGGGQAVDLVPGVPDAFTDRTGVLQLLDQGFHHVHIVVGNTFGSPSALQHFDAFYEALQKGGLAKKGALIGISRGGLYAYNWAARHPEAVSCIYGDAPVCDFKSWPGGKGKGKGSAGDWASLQKHYGFKDEAGRAGVEEESGG